MKIVFYGVRGSYPVPDQRMSRVGGNSSSLMVEDEGMVAFLDAGTGIISGGKSLVQRKVPAREIAVFLTHLHTDHIQGLPFFLPVYDARCRIRVYCPLTAKISLQESIQSLFVPPFSPVTLKGIKARLEYIQLDPGNGGPLPVAGNVSLHYRWHPHHPQLGSAIFRLTSGKRSLVYATDIESPAGFDPEMIDFIRGADLLIHDSQYRDQDYFGACNGRRGFGHSSVSAAAANAHLCHVKKLILFHFDPDYSDKILEAMEKQARKQFPHTELAREHLKINLRS